MRPWVERSAWVSKRAVRNLAAMDPARVLRVAVIKHGGLGDMLITRPFMIEARRLFPRAELTLSTTSDSTLGVPADLADRLHVIPRRLGNGVGLRETAASFRALGPQDVIFDITASSRSQWVTRVNPARLRVGWKLRGLKHRALYDLALGRPDYQFEGETLLQQLLAVGGNPAWPPRFDLPVLESSSTARRSPYVVYFPTALEPIKCWPPERFAALIELAVERHPEFDHVLLTGLADWERRAADELLTHCGAAAALELVEGGEQSFPLLQSAAALVCNDTGLRNYAIAAGTPTVGLFFATLPWRYFPRFGGHRLVFEPELDLPSVETAARVLGETLDALHVVHPARA